MAVAHGIAPDTVDALERLRSEPHRYSLFAALRLLEQVHKTQPRLGEARRLAQDPVRLQQPPYLSFAPSEVVALRSTEQGMPLLEAYGFGLFGPNGALPLHLTELAFERRRHHADPTLSDFINLFQHRLLELFYRAWAESDPATCHDRPDSDRFRLFLGALSGMGTQHSLGRTPVSDCSVLSRAALFGNQCRSAEGLQQILADYFDLPVLVRSFVSDWLDIPAEMQTRLGATDESSCLGLGTTLGSASWQAQHKFEIVIGPLSHSDFGNFLPGSAGLRELSSLVRLYTNDEWQWQLCLQLRRDEVPRMHLGAGSMLGWSSWLGNVQEADYQQVIIQGEWSVNGLESHDDALINQSRPTTESVSYE
jgi:type VI secretion system protein ImpH